MTLLAVSPSAQKMGVGKLLINSAEAWAKKQGYRLLHLEVFANNNNAQRFYQNLGFEPEMLHMVKPLNE
ncbi:MAG: GNAT family N-acetyltransferase [Thalassotalea sp.]|nr:GNAT family N-acetyltransferase [Thalassotalea sp.]